MTGRQTQQQFHHREDDANQADECQCPIHRNRDREPFTAPLGWPFAEHVEARPITREQAAGIYDAHHSYMQSVPTVNLAHHGIAYQREVLGAVTWRYPLLQRKRLYLDADGQPVPGPRSRERIKDRLPEDLHYTALEVLHLDRTAEEDVTETVVVDGDHFVEAARICLGVRMANLASAGLARSQERFVHGPQCEPAVEYLLTFVRADYDATMLRALRDKGWTCVGWTRPSQAGNRPDKDIREYRKWTFLCPVETVQEQTSLARWS